MVSPANIYLLRGLGDNLFSQGMDELARRLTALYPHADVSIWNWYDWHKVIADMHVAKPGTRFVLIGYSMGANEVTGIAADGLPISLLIAMDPTLWDSVSPLLGNVKRAVLFHDTNPINLVGHATLTLGAGFNPNSLITHTTADLHSSIDKDLVIRSIVLSEVASALA